MKRDVGRATLLVAISACCFGSISPLTVIALRHGAALQGVQAWRYATTASVLSLVAMWQGRREGNRGGNGNNLAAGRNRLATRPAARIEYDAGRRQRRPARPIPQLGIDRPDPRRTVQRKRQERFPGLP